MLLFTWLAYTKIPDRLDTEAERRRFTGFPMFRLATLATGVFCIAASGAGNGCEPAYPADPRRGPCWVALTFRLDRNAANNLFPPKRAIDQRAGRAGAYGSSLSMA